MKKGPFKMNGMSWKSGQSPIKQLVTLKTDPYSIHATDLPESVEKGGEKLGIYKEETVGGVKAFKIDENKLRKKIDMVTKAPKPNKFSKKENGVGEKTKKGGGMGKEVLGVLATALASKVLAPREPVNPVTGLTQMQFGKS